MSDIVERLRTPIFKPIFGEPDERQFNDPTPLMLEAADEIERLRSATQWQPIETAPKDGTRVLAANVEKVAITYFSKSRGAWIDESEVDDDGHGWVGHDVWDPTHWQPLPAPPETKETE